MILSIVEKLFRNMNEKSHIKPLLPGYSLICAVITEEECAYLSISKTKLELLNNAENIDVKIEGPTQTILSVLSGSTSLRKADIAFTGSLRHKLMLDSIFSLCKERTYSLTEEKILL